MKSYIQNLTIPQSEPLDDRQVKNNAGGFAYEVSPLMRLRRFLILGADGGTYYVSPGKHIRDNMRNMDSVIKENPEEARAFKADEHRIKGRG